MNNIQDELIDTIRTLTRRINGGGSAMTITSAGNIVLNHQPSKVLEVPSPKKTRRKKKDDTVTPSMVDIYLENK